MGVQVLGGYKQVLGAIDASAPSVAPAPAQPAASPTQATQAIAELEKRVTQTKNALALRQPDRWVQQVYQHELGRRATAKDLQGARAAIAPVLKKDGTVEAAKKAVTAAIKKTAEYKLVHNDGWVSEMVKNQLHRQATAKDQKAADREVAGVIKKHGSVDAGKQAVKKAIQGSAEYKKLHPTINKHRDALYIAQPNGWTCGPTSLTMALKAFGIRPNAISTINEMVRRTGASPDCGVPGNASLIAKAAESVGAQASYSPSGSPSAVRSALKKGHGVVLNGSLGTGGHFIYVAGLASDGRFIICDPARSGITRMTDAELDHFANTYGNPRGFAEIWK